VKVYHALGIDCPSSVPLAGGRLKYRERKAQEQQPSKPESRRTDYKED